MGSKIIGPLWLRVLATFVGTVCAMLNWMMLLAIGPVLAAVYPDSNTAIAIVFACKYFVQMISNPIAAFLVHGDGPWPTGLLGIFGYLTATVVFGLFPNNLWVLALMMCLQGFSGACMFSGTQAAMLLHYPDAEQGHAVSYCMFGLSLGLFIGPLYGGVVYDAVGYFWTFYSIAIIAGAALVGGCLTTFFELVVYKMPVVAVSSSTQPISDVQFVYNFIASAAIALTKDPRLLNFFGTFSVEVFVLAALITIESFYLERVGWSPSLTGVAASVMSVFYGLISLGSGQIATNCPQFVVWSPYPCLVLLGVISPLIGLYTQFIPIFVINFVCGILFGTIEAFGVFNYRLLLRDSPIAFTLTDVSICLGGFTGSLVGGILNDHLPRTLYALAICGGIGAAVGLVTTTVALVFHIRGSDDTCSNSLVIATATATDASGEESNYGDGIDLHDGNARADGLLEAGQGNEETPLLY